MKNYEVGLTLSGGGARGYAHIGVLKAMEEFKITPNIVSGTSMGAIIGSLIANGYTSEEIIDFAQHPNYLKIFDFKGFKLGLSTHKRVRSILNELLPDDFESLKLPLRISATNLSKAQLEVFSSGPLIDAVLASISIPVIFKPVEIKGNFYADGGLVQNLPADSIRDECKTLIGSHVNHIPLNVEISNTFKIIDRCIRIAIFNTVQSQIKLCDIFIDPLKGGQFDVLNFKAVKELVDLGYNSAINEIKNKYINRN